MSTEQRKPKFALVAQVPDEDDAEEDEGEEDEVDQVVDSPLSLRPPPQAKITEGEEEEDESDDLTLSKEPTSEPVTSNNNNQTNPTADSKNAEKKYENYVNTIAQTKGQQARAGPSPNTPLEKKIHELNDSLRKHLAKKITNLYESTNKELLQTSIVLNRTLTTTRVDLDLLFKELNSAKDVEAQKTLIQFLCAIESVFGARVCKRLKSTIDLCEAFDICSFTARQQELHTNYESTHVYTNLNIDMQTEKILSEKKEIVVCFSGFPDDVKKQLAESVYSLYGKVKWDVGIDADITHVVTKPSCRTMKTLAAGITCKWLVSLDWIIDSARVGYFLPEIGYGIRNSEWLFQKKRFFISPKFKAKYKKYRMRCCYTLIKLGGGQLVNSTKHADYVLVTTKESLAPHWLLTANPNNKTEILVWGTFINLIAPKEIVRSPIPLIERCLQVVSQDPSQIGADKIRSRLSLDLKEKILEYLAETQTLNPRNMEFFLDSRLTELNLQECIVTQASLDSIKICENLKSLDISGIKAEEDISELALIKLIQKLPNLSCLKMNKWRITDMMLSRLAKKENLTHLEISQCNRLSAGAILDFINEVQNLRSFALADIPIVNDKVVCALADKCGENLIALDISKNEGISDLSVLKLASKCRNLIELKVKRTAVSFNAILLLIESCPNLKHLDVYNCKDFVPKALRQLKDKFPYLKLTHTKFIKTSLNFIGGNGSEDSL